MRGTPIEALIVPSAQYGTFVALSDGQVDGPRRARHERDHCGHVALSKYPQGSMAALDGEVLDTGRAGLADPQTVESEQYRQCGVTMVIAFGRKEESPQLGPVNPRASEPWTWGLRTY
jgi:hypothetical protein